MKKTTLIIIFAIFLIPATAFAGSVAGGIFNEHWICPYVITNLSDEPVKAVIHIGGDGVHGDFIINVAGNDSEIVLLRDMVSLAFSYIGTPVDADFHDIMLHSLRGDESLKIWCENSDIVIQGPFIRERK